MITDHEQRQMETRRRLLGGWGIDLEETEPAAPLDAKASPKAKYGWTALTVKPKPALREQRPKTETMKTGPSWLVLGAAHRFHGGMRTSLRGDVERAGGG